jgi:multiple sugar transport system ATP-binding protein
VAEILRITGKLKNRATQLSGGEKLRVAIGRALFSRAWAYLMDEPLSSLDAKLRADLRLELKHIQQDLGATILYVTHDQIEAMTMANRIGILDQGRLVQIGTPREIYESPKNVYVAARLGQPAINLFPARLLRDERMPRAARTVGARTEHFRIAKATNGTSHATVDWIEHLGDQTHLHVTMNDHKLITLVDSAEELSAGDAVTVELTSPLYFDDSGRRLEPAVGV